MGSFISVSMLPRALLNAKQRQAPFAAMILRHWNFCGRPDRRNFPCLFLPLAPPKVDHFATSRGAAMGLNSARHLVGTMRLLRHPRPSDLLQI
jgi:hypothetical protein